MSLGSGGVLGSSHPGYMRCEEKRRGKQGKEQSEEKLLQLERNQCYPLILFADS
jgi:hypothetical protein